MKEIFFVLETSYVPVPFLRVYLGILLKSLELVALLLFKFLSILMLYLIPLDNSLSILLNTQSLLTTHSFFLVKFNSPHKNTSKRVSLT